MEDKREIVRWVDYTGRGVLPEPPAQTRGESKIVTEIREENSIESLAFRDPEYFMAGGLHKCLGEWKAILTDTEDGQQVSQWLEGGVDVKIFFRQFKGNFRGRNYNCDTPPKAYFANASTCKEFTGFIEKTLTERLRNGSVSIWGQVGEVSPPKVVMPLIVEPTKPRLCLDARYVNLWTRDCPFTLETLRDVPRMIEEGGFMTSCDEKSGYDHVCLSSESRQYFGFQWGGWYYVFNTIPFGWKASPFVYQTIGAMASGYIRERGVPCLQYIDDRLNGQACQHSTGEKHSNLERAKQGIYVVASVLTSLGYTLALKKSQLLPVRVIRFLGMLINTLLMAFVVPSDKRETFDTLLQCVLSKTHVDVNTLQRIQGKCASFLLAVPAAKLYMREMAAALSKATKNSALIPLGGALREELEHWTFLKDWQEATPWRQEKHLQVCLASDASRYKWGGVVLSGDRCGISMGDYWNAGDERPIHIKEAHALLQTLRSVQDQIINHRVDAYVDNQAVCKAWESKGCKNQPLNDMLKRLYALTVQQNIELRTYYIPSESNPADAPSRQVSLTDTSLTQRSWDRIQWEWGPHTVDLMALDTNAMTDLQGNPLPHFTQSPTPGSAGVNVFAQDIAQQSNPYVFPPFILIGPLIKLMHSQRVARCTMVVPKKRPVPYWWPLLERWQKGKFQLGTRGDRGVLRIPTQEGFREDNRGLAWDLWVFRLALDE